MAILYEDKITKSMKKAIDETERRREKQTEFNEKHGITPTTINKKVADIMDGAYSNAAKRYAKVAEEQAEYEGLTTKQFKKKVEQLEQEMYKHAQNLEFEEAANIRDKIKKFEEGQLGIN